MIHDAYPNIKWSYEASVYYESLFPNKELEHVAQASVVEYYKHNYGDKVQSWLKYQNGRSSDCTIRMNTYYFEIPKQPYDQSIVTHFAILETLHETYGNNYSVYAGFWPKGFLELKELSKLRFGFNENELGDADDLLIKFKYLKKVLFFKIVNNSIEGINEKKLFDLIQDFNKKGQDEMIKL